MKRFKLTIGIKLIVFFILFSCKDEKGGVAITKSPTKPKELSTLIVYNDSIGDVQKSIVRMRYKIDSLYDEMLQDSYKSSNEYLEANVLNSKKLYQNLFDTNSLIYQQSFENATGSGAAAVLYEYYYLCKYYEDILLLQIDLRNFVLDYPE